MTLLAPFTTTPDLDANVHPDCNGKRLVMGAARAYLPSSPYLREIESLNGRSNSLLTDPPAGQEQTVSLSVYLIGSGSRLGLYLPQEALLYIVAEYCSRRLTFIL